MRGHERTHPARRGDHALLEQAEVETVAVPDDHLAVEHGAGRDLGERGRRDVGEPVGQVAALLGPQPGRGRGADDDQPVAVPLRLVQAAPGQGIGRRDRRDRLC